MKTQRHLSQEIDWFLDEQRVTKGASSNTIAAYRRDLQRYRDFLLVNQIDSFASVSSDTIELYLQELASGTESTQPLAKSSVARHLAALRSLHRWLVTQNLIPTDVAKDVCAPKAAKRLPKALSVDQVQKLLEAARRGDDPVSLRDTALLEFLYATGARVSEAIRISLDDLELDDEVPFVTVRGKGGKERLVPLGNYAKDALGSYLVRGRPALCRSRTPADRVFLNLRGNALSRQSAWEILQNVAERVDLSESVSPHTLRHSFATHLLEGGASIREVQELLGHASVTTTQIYTRMNPQTLQEVYRSSHPRAIAVAPDAAKML